MTEPEIKKILVAIIAEESGVQANRIIGTSRLGADLGIGNTIGSAEFLDLKERIEKRFEVEIPTSAIPPADKIINVTVDEVVAFLYGLLLVKTGQTSA